MNTDELLCPTCGTPVGAEVTGAELRSRYEKGRRAALDRMVEIADESGMYDLPPEPEPGRSRRERSFDEVLLAAQEAYYVASEAYTAAAQEAYLAALDRARANVRELPWKDIKRRARKREQEREQGRAAEDVQPNFSAAPKVEVEEKGEGSRS